MSQDPAGSGRETYRLITPLLDERGFPAEQLAATYHERWEVETALDEVRVHQWAHPHPLRSKHPPRPLIPTIMMRPCVTGRA